MRFLLRARSTSSWSLLGVLWLIPTLGLFLTSILPAQAFTVKGWWQIFSHPSLATWANYDSVLHNHAITHSLVITAEIAVGEHADRDRRRRARRLRVRVARVSRAGTGSSSS